MVYMVGEIGLEGEKEKKISQVKNEGNPWEVASETRHGGGRRLPMLCGRER